jgi:hypothetical protein
MDLDAVSSGCDLQPDAAGWTCNSWVLEGNPGPEVAVAESRHGSSAACSHEPIPAAAWAGSVKIHSLRSAQVACKLLDTGGGLTCAAMASLPAALPALMDVLPTSPPCLFLLAACASSHTLQRRTLVVSGLLAAHSGLVLVVVMGRGKVGAAGEGAQT